MKSVVSKVARVSFAELSRMGTGPQGMILILSHMRSGSSLLTHLISSHPDVIAIGEAHLSYLGTESRHQLVGKVYTRARKLLMQEGYVCDKVLHDRHEIGIGCLKMQV